MSSESLTLINGVLLGLISLVAAVSVASITSRQTAMKDRIQGLENALESCKRISAEALDDEIVQRRGLQAEVTSLKQDLAIKNQQLIDALINRQQYIRRADDLKDGA